MAFLEHVTDARVADGGPTGDQVPGPAPLERSPSEAVALALADEQGLDATELPPLYASIDPEALDALLRRAPDARVTFTHHGYEITVDGRGDVALAPTDEA